LRQHRSSHLDLLSSLARGTGSKIVLLVVDGVGGLGVKGKTELETARTPNLDDMAREASCGLSIPVLPGITPGSGPSHLALFGYDPLVSKMGRGALEVYGVGRSLSPGQIGARGNFCNLDKDGIVRDRRAGRLKTEENARLCKHLNEKIKEIDGVIVDFIPGKEHRFVLILTGEGLTPNLTDTDPHEDMKHYAECAAVIPDGERSASVVNSLMKTVLSLLAEEEEATGMILRGFSGRPDIPTLGDLYSLNPAAIATYPMYKGIASVLGMDIIECEGSLEGQLAALGESFDRYDFFYFHFKLTDMAGEDGDFGRKVRLIEDCDGIVKRIRNLNPEVLVVTGDHSTPSVMRKHSWHPNPFMILSASARADLAQRFTEAECTRGCLGTFEARYAMGLMLAHAGKLEKFGA